MADTERKMNSLLKLSRQSLSEFWIARDAREHTMLVAAAVVIAFGLIYALLIDPALAGRNQLNKNLPVLRQQAAQLQALAKEAAALSGKSAAPVAVMSGESIEAALLRKGLKPQNVTLAGGVARVQLVAVSFSGTLNWLDEMQKTAQLSVVDANIVALAQPDMVDVTLTLRQHRNE